MVWNRLFALVALAAGLALAACSGPEAKRIAGDAVKGSLRSACASADNCTQECGDGAPAPQGARCVEKP